MGGSEPFDLAALGRCSEKLSELRLTFAEVTTETRKTAAVFLVSFFLPPDAMTADPPKLSCQNLWKVYGPRARRVFRSAAEPD